MKDRRTTRLTDARIARLKPRRTEYIVWDSRVAGLGVRVRASGHRGFVWHAHANGKVARVTIGSTRSMTVDDARTDCLALQNGTARAGKDDIEPGFTAPLFKDFVLEEWKATVRGGWGTARRRSVDGILKNQLLPTFGARRMDRIHRRDVERWFDAYSLTAPGGANHSLHLLRQIMKAAVATGLIATDPAQGIRTNPRLKLERFLSSGEIDRLHRTLDRLVEERPSRRSQADVIRLLLLTGCRRSEILTLRWSEVDGDALRLAKAKTGPRTVWLSEAAQALLARQPCGRSEYVFPSPKDPARVRHHELTLWYQARREAGIEDVRLHDLRHTVASQAVARGVPLSTVARMLGHSDPRMTLRYAHIGDRDVEAAAHRIGKAITRAMETGRARDG